MKKISFFLSIILVFILFPVYSFAKVKNTSGHEILVTLTNIENPKRNYMVSVPIDINENMTRTYKENEEINIITDVVVTIPEMILKNLILLYLHIQMKIMVYL